MVCDGPHDDFQLFVVCRVGLGKRKAHFQEVGPSKRAALREEVRVMCGSSSGLYNIRGGFIALRVAQNGQASLHSPFILFFMCCLVDNADMYFPKLQILLPKRKQTPVIFLV